MELVSSLHASAFFPRSTPCLPPRHAKLPRRCLRPSCPPSRSAVCGVPPSQRELPRNRVWTSAFLPFAGVQRSWATAFRCTFCCATLTLALTLTATRVIRCGPNKHRDQGIGTAGWGWAWTLCDKADRLRPCHRRRVRPWPYAITALWVPTFGLALPPQPSHGRHARATHPVVGRGRDPRAGILYKPRHAASGENGASGQ